MMDWLEETCQDDVLNGKPEAYCKLCKCHLRAHHSDFITHQKSNKHREKEKALDRRVQFSLPQYDLQLAVYIAMHTPIKSVDHLGELLKILGKVSKLEHVRHRTKCSKLILAVVSSALLTELVQHVWDSPFSIIADESTDVSTSKFMGLCIRFYSQREESIVTDFLGIVEVTKCTGEILAKTLLEYLCKIGLPPKNLFAIGTDDASNMCGLNNSFYTHLKKEVPNLQMIKCVCHSLDKCAQYAFRKMPDYLNYLLKETYNWFALRQSEYKEYYKTMNKGKNPGKLQKLCDTRWMSWLPVASEILNQWTELHGFFRIKASENDYKALTFTEILDDPTNLLYVTFLKSILREVHFVNLAFEQTNVDITKVYSDLRVLFFSLSARVSLSAQSIAETSRSGVLRSVEIQMLKKALSELPVLEISQ
ncbi:uncharacterized protein LOC118647840 isoform X2 [Monomorium pharaonis]|uniref:uncharacterized protein LOC118647840 isoform X2 n=1 Tax=Monomorium pharaonis TaxID=307658 RepID=UPI0017477D0D|nr:uncharacterized protein LOC118647840 isoform X2 [Monomorium pharaonis]